MLLAILIFILITIIFSINIKFIVLSRKDTIKLYVTIGKINILIPHHELLKKPIKIKKKRIKKDTTFALNIISHSTLDHIFIAKSTESTCCLNNVFYLIIGNQIIGLLTKKFRLVNKKNLVLIYDGYYENIDYYFKAHINIITILWVLILNIF